MQAVEGRVLRPRKGAPAPAKRKIEDSQASTSATRSKPAKQARTGKKLEPSNSTTTTKAKRAPKSPKTHEVVSDELKQHSVRDFEVTTIDGQVKPLRDYKDHACIIVNVASRCGHTAANYKRLVELFEKYNEKGLRILAFPCNQFGKQEPGDNEKIKEFAGKKNVQFDMFAKIDVKGAKAEPLWEYLNRVCPGPKPDIEWNFVKFLVDKEGQVVKRYKPSVKSLVDLEEDLNNVCQIV